MENKKQEPKKACVSQKNTLPVEKPKPWTVENKAALAIVIGRIFDLQKQFGKTPAQLESLVDGFCWVLGEYRVERVIWGFGEYIKRRADMPAPCEIVQIIDPQPMPWKPDKSYYIKLQEIFKKDGPYGLNDDEYEYIRAYEAYMLKERHSAKE